MVSDLKLSKPSQWYSTLKRITSYDQVKLQFPKVHEINQLPDQQQAEEIATQQFNAAKKEQNTMEQSRGTSFFRRKRDKSAHHRRSKSLGKVINILYVM